MVWSVQPAASTKVATPPALPVEQDTLKRTQSLRDESARTSRRVAASIWHLAVGANQLVIGAAVVLAHLLRFGTTRATRGWARFTGLLGPAA